MLRHLSGTWHWGITSRLSGVHTACKVFKSSCLSHATLLPLHLSLVYIAAPKINPDRILDRISISSIQIECGYVVSPLQNLFHLNARALLFRVLLHEHGGSHEPVSMALLPYPRNQRGSVTPSQACSEYWPGSTHKLWFESRLAQLVWWQLV